MIPNRLFSTINQTVTRKIHGFGNGTIKSMLYILLALDILNNSVNRYIIPFYKVRNPERI